MRLLLLSRKLDYATIEIYEALYDRRRAANVILLSVQCVESVVSYGICGRRGGVDRSLFHIPMFTKAYAILAMSVENDCPYGGQVSAMIRRSNKTHILL